MNKTGSVCSLAMLELVASLEFDLSDQRVTTYNSDQEVVRVIPVSTGKASTSKPIFNSKVYTNSNPPRCMDAPTPFHGCRSRCA